MKWQGQRQWKKDGGGGEGEDGGGKCGKGEKSRSAAGSGTNGSCGAVRGRMAGLVMPDMDPAWAVVNGGGGLWLWRRSGLWRWSPKPTMDPVVRGQRIKIYYDLDKEWHLARVDSYNNINGMAHVS